MIYGVIEGSIEVGFRSGVDKEEKRLMIMIVRALKRRLKQTPFKQIGIVPAACATR